MSPRHNKQASLVHMAKSTRYSEIPDPFEEDESYKSEGEQLEPKLEEANQPPYSSNPMQTTESNSANKSRESHRGTDNGAAGSLRSLLYSPGVSMAPLEEGASGKRNKQMFFTNPLLLERLSEKNFLKL